VRPRTRIFERSNRGTELEMEGGSDHAVGIDFESRRESSMGLARRRRWGRIECPKTKDRRIHHACSPAVSIFGSSSQTHPAHRPHLHGDVLRSRPENALSRVDRQPTQLSGQVRSSRQHAQHGPVLLDGPVLHCIHCIHRIHPAIRGKDSIRIRSCPYPSHRDRPCRLAWGMDSRHRRWPLRCSPWRRWHPTGLA
jgi:hypothetical protein